MRLTFEVLLRDGESQEASVATELIRGFSRPSTANVFGLIFSTFNPKRTNDPATASIRKRQSPAAEDPIVVAGSQRQHTRFPFSESIGIRVPTRPLQFCRQRVERCDHAALKFARRGDIFGRSRRRVGFNSKCCRGLFVTLAPPTRIRSSASLQAMRTNHARNFPRSRNR